jgi:hypothetical protein
VTIIARIRGQASEQGAKPIGNLIGAVVPGPMGAVVSGALVRAIKEGPQALSKIVPTKEGLVDLTAGEVTRGINRAEDNRRKQQDRQFTDQVLGRGAYATPRPTSEFPEEAAPNKLAPTAWPAAPLWGGLTLKKARELFTNSASEQRAWKNLWHVTIKDLQPSKEAPAGAEKINLLAVDVSFAPYIMPGEAMTIGSAVIDKLASTDRVELRLTTFDDSVGSLKRWFYGKCDQTANDDGTFGLPAQYLCEITVVHMDPEGKATPKERMTHRWLMRPSNIENELSRRAAELEELQMSFVQFDTCMQPT